MQKNKFYKSEFSRQSSFQKMFDSDYFYINTVEDDHWNKKFHTALLTFLKNQKIIDPKYSDLKALHTFLDDKYLDFKSSKKNNNFRPAVCDNLFDFANQEIELYHEMLKWIYRCVIKEDFYFQIVPTIRVHFPKIEKRTLPAWHSDCFFGHPPSEINFWFGITDNKKSDFWVNSVSKSRKWFSDFSYDTEQWSQTCFSADKDFNKYGFQGSIEIQEIFDNIFIFDSRCIHTAVPRSRDDETTKLSIDMRIILVKDFEWKIINDKPLFVGTGIKQAEFRPGHPYGYNKKSIKQIMEDS